MDASGKVLSSAMVPQDDADSKQDSLGFHTVNAVREFRGTYSGVEERKDVTIEDKASWEALWHEMGGMYTSGHSDPPEVNFDGKFAVAVFMGQKSSGGYSTTIDEIELDGNTLKVYVRERAPRPGQIVTMALSQPYHILILPRNIDDHWFDGKKGYQVSFITKQDSAKK